MMKCFPFFIVVCVVIAALAISLIRQGRRP